jgi:predicted DNA-binding antitoxin AbrB/MazE fold protein
MRKIVEAIYANGVFRPLEPVVLEKGEHVHVQLPELTATQQDAWRPWMPSSTRVRI